MTKVPVKLEKGGKSQRGGGRPPILPHPAPPYPATHTPSAPHQHHTPSVSLNLSSSGGRLPAANLTLPCLLTVRKNLKNNSVVVAIVSCRATSCVSNVDMASGVFGAEGLVSGAIRGFERRLNVDVAMCAGWALLLTPVPLQPKKGWKLVGGDRIGIGMEVARDAASNSRNCRAMQSLTFCT